MSNKSNLEEININGKVFLKTRKWINDFQNSNYIIPKDYTFLIERLEFKEHKIIGRPKEEQIIPVFTEPYDVIIDGKKWRVCPINPFIHVTEEGEFGYIERDNFGKEKGFRYMGFGKNNINNFYKYKTYKTTINNKEESYNIHKLIALAFIPNDDYYNKYYVEHINGNKVDNRASNLRWIGIEDKVTKNLRKTLGLNDDSKYVVRNIDTGEIKNFISKNDILLYYKVDKLWDQKENFEKGKIFIFPSGRFEIQTITGFKGWGYDKKLPNGKYVNSPLSYKIWVKNLDNGEIKYYDNLPSFHTVLKNMALRTLRERLKNEKFRKYPIENYVVKFNKEDPWPDELPDFDRECKTMIKKRDMVAVSVDGKEQHEFPSMQKLCEYFKIDHKAVKAYMKEDKPFKRLDKEWKVNFKE